MATAEQRTYEERLRLEQIASLYETTARDHMLFGDSRSAENAGANYAACKAGAAALARVAALEAALRSLEWSRRITRTDGQTSNACPACGKLESTTHGPDCWLRAALGGAQ